MGKKTFLLAFIMFLMPLAVLAASPFIQTSEPASALTIIYPQIEHANSNGPYVINVHVYNSTNDKAEFPETNCEIHIYNSEGNELASQMMNHSGEDFYFELNNSLTDHEEIGYLVYCNQSYTREKGFVSSALKFYPGGLSPFSTNTTALLFATMLIPIVLLMFTAILDRETKIHNVLRVFMYTFAIYSLRFSVHTALKASEGTKYYPALSNAYSGVVYLFAAYMVYLFILVLVFTMLNWKKLLQQMKEAMMSR